MSKQRPLEYCQWCDKPTGRAGAADDSLFVELPTDDGCTDTFGPLCDTCFQRVQPAAERIEELEAIVEKLPRMEDGALWCMTDEFWFTDNDGKIICDRTRDFTLKELANFIDGEWGPCYSTRAAAETAAKEGAGT